MHVEATSIAQNYSSSTFIHRKGHKHPVLVSHQYTTYTGWGKLAYDFADSHLCTAVANGASLKITGQERGFKKNYKIWLSEFHLVGQSQLILYSMGVSTATGEECGYDHKLEVAECQQTINLETETSSTTDGS